MALLSVEGLTVRFFTEGSVVHAVEDVSFSVEAGEILGLVGESGSGKSATGYAIMGLVDRPGKIVSGRVVFDGADLVGLRETQLRRLRGNRLAMILQDPASSLNPVLRIGDHMVESILAHRETTPGAARLEARDALARVGIPSPEERLDAYPHQLSGGMRQRVCIALALLHRPALVVADEPTTALDVTIQAQILYEVQKLAAETGTAWIWITHDLSIVSGLADRVAVMYAGRLVEEGPVDRVLDSPAHPYTRGLIGASPAGREPGTPLQQISGGMPSLMALDPGCSFRARCDRAATDCAVLPFATGVQGGGWVRCHHPVPAGKGR